jgi:alkanesulfonate monooxygenase SsuD/methylene tetrahydromethanopterin reductase-like flavin-dependent oxidoreductase (luciferase family)
VGLGNGVVPIYPRHPVAMAQAALTLAEQTGGRFRLGVGVSHRASMEAALGLPLTSPLEDMREYVAALRPALAGKADVQGRHHRVRWTYAVPEPPPAPPLYLAALSTRMLELAGELADGAVLWLTPPAYVRDVAVPALERGRRKAGRPLAGFDIVVAVPLAVTAEPAAALEAFRGELDRDGQTPVRLAQALGGIGDPGTTHAFVQAYRDAGATLPAVRPITFPEASWYAGTLQAAAGW